MKRFFPCEPCEPPQVWKRFCSTSSDIFVSKNSSSSVKTESKKEFYTGENGIIKLKENIISIVDPTPRVINRYILAALRKPGIYFVQTKSSVLGPFKITPMPDDLPKGELVMIYECCGSFSESSTSCFRPIGLFQN